MYTFDSNNNHLFIGVHGNSEIVTRLNELGCNVSTGYNVQKKFMEGLEELGIYADTITGHVSPPFLKGEMIIDYCCPNRNENVTDIYVSFLNIPLLDKVIKGIKISKAAKKWAKNKEKAYIFVYSLSSAYLMGAVAAKRKNPNCKIISIVPDLPEFMSNSTSKIYRFLKKIDRHHIEKKLESADAFVLFAEPMKERLPVYNKPYKVVEGIIKNLDEKEYFEKVNRKIADHKKIIMLSGNLDCEEGIPALLEAFSQIKDQEYQLWLTGTGNSVELIEKSAKQDSRIKYYGYIDSYEDFLALQQQAFVFVVMVPPQNEKSAYYFPSKLMEYMVTGGIVACHKLRCIPKEYDDYLEYFPDDVEGISQKLIELCELDEQEFQKRALARFRFMQTKMPGRQMEKLIELLNKLDNG